MKKYFTIATILLLAAACNKTASQDQNQPIQTQSSSTPAELKPPAILPPLPDTLKGTLKVSNNSAKGNLMLVNTDAVTIGGKNITIYLQTQRDFSPLIDKKVIVHFEGGPGQFTLKSIEEDK